MSFDDIWFWGVAIAGTALWVAALVSFFRMPSAAWATDLERYLMLGWLVLFGVLGAAVWFLGVRKVLRERVSLLQPESDGAPTEAWRLKHLT